MPIDKPAAPAAPRRPARDAVERLYVYWLVSTVVLILVAIILALFTRGALRQVQAQAERSAALERTVGELDERLAGLEDELARPAAARRPAPPPDVSELVPPDERAPDTAAATGARPPGPPEPPDTADAVEPAPLAEAELEARIERLMHSDEVLVWAVTDVEAARALTQLGLQELGRADWSGAAWARLAELARLVERDAAAEAFARRAMDAGDPLVRFAEVSARAFLGRGRPGEALGYARQLVERTEGAPTAVLLLAQALFDAGQLTAAEDALRTLPDAAGLAPVDRLRLGRLYLALQHLPLVAAVLQLIRVDELPEALAPEYNFLYAITLTQAGRTVEALAILDYLAAQPARPRPAGAPPWPAPQPESYEILVWRGVTLWSANQPEAARAALDQAAAADPGRPDAYYYRGVLEAQAGRAAIAMDYLKNALASSTRMVAAWEALALLELDAGQVESALEHLARAIDLNARRASAHFAVAVARAKVSQAPAAAAALRTALQLDPGYLAVAKQTEVILRLFTPAELEALAAAPAGDAAPAGAGPPAPGGR